jgi:hypothetical protein
MLCVCVILIAAETIWRSLCIAATSFGGESMRAQKGERERRESSAAAAMGFYAAAQGPLRVSQHAVKPLH